MPAPTNYSGTRPPQGRPRPPKEHGRRKQSVLNVLGILVALYAVYEALGVSNFFDVTGMSNDDAKMAAESMAWKLLFDPAGFALSLSLLVSAFVIHALSKQMQAFSTAATRTGLIVTGAAFVLSFFKVSIVFPLLFSSLGIAANELKNGSDVRTPAAEEFILEAAQLIQYRGSPGVRIASALTNNSKDHWQNATVAVTYTDAGGAACGGLEQIEDHIAPGQQRAMVTDFLSAAMYYSDPSCVPVTATAKLVSIDIDSRPEIMQADYESTALVFDSLMPLEEPGIGGGVVKLSVAGALSPESMSTLRDGTRLPVGFEVADQQGLRLDRCFKPDDVAADGTFTTGTYHSPVDPGEFPFVIVVPAEC